MQGLVALGANLPVGEKPPQATLAAALSALAARGLRVDRVSRFYATPCFPAGAGPDYVNAAAVVTVPEGTGPQEVLRHLHAVEAEFGRERAQRWGMRTLDLDLVAFGDSVLPDARTQEAWQALALADQIGRTPEALILPHPRMQDRAFVLVPLADVAPDWRHPLRGQTVAEMLAALPQADREAVVAM